METYKKEFVEKQRIIQKNNPSIKLENSKSNFYSKLILNFDQYNCTNYYNNGSNFSQPNYYTTPSPIGFEFVKDNL